MLRCITVRFSRAAGSRVPMFVVVYTKVLGGNREKWYRENFRGADMAGVYVEPLGVVESNIIALCIF